MLDAQYASRLYSSPKRQHSRLTPPSPNVMTNTPSPKKSPKTIYYDRHIPSTTANQLKTSFALLDNFAYQGYKRGGETEHVQNDSEVVYKQILQNELLGLNSNTQLQLQPQLDSEKKRISPKRLFSYKTSNQQHINNENDYTKYSLSPFSNSSQKLFINNSPIKRVQRNIPKEPSLVLGAPQLSDDFYLNLLDWSSSNILAVGLEEGVFLWNATNNKVVNLQDDIYSSGESSSDFDSDSSFSAMNVTALSWASSGSQLAIGCNDGTVAIWDIETKRRIRKLVGHNTRVGTIAWANSPHMISSGSRDGVILYRDMRDNKDFSCTMLAHSREVCGLKWSDPSSDLLASGGNDNKVFVWDARTLHNDRNMRTSNNTLPARPLWEFTQHTAAVKGLAWSPHQKGLLASGGGTADQCIRVWDTKDGSLENSLNTGSQVCNLAWSKNVNEIVSTHGFCDNQISVWSYPSFKQVVSLTGHTRRVLYLSASPDGQTIVTGSGDETLRFWKIFPVAKSKKVESARSLDWGWDTSAISNIR